MRFLKKSTAITIVVGPFLDVADFITPKTALVPGDITAAIVKGASRSGITLTASGGSNDFVHLGDGYYSLELTAGDVDTAGHLRVTFRDDDAFVPVFEDFTVTPGDLGDELHRVKAFLANKKIKTLATGVLVVKDDDGTTTLITITPTEDATTFTVTPS